MNYLRNSVLATIAYHDCLDYPLTSFEVHKFLINPARVNKLNEGISEIKQSAIFSELETLVKLGVISKNGEYYFLNRRQSLVQDRLDKKKISDKKWLRFLMYSRFLLITPYLKGMFGSGSMGMDNANLESDYDLLIIGKAGRLYTARLFLWLIASIMGVRRKPGQLIAPDKLCFNHFISDDNLKLQHESLYNAQTYINLKPIYVPENLFNAFFGSNIWLNNFVYNFRPQGELLNRKLEINFLSKFFLTIGKFLEIVLDTSLGDWLELKTKTYQQKRISENPITNEPGGRIVFTDKEIEFHPYSFEKIVLEKYKNNLDKLAVAVPFQEKDSGLN